VGIDNFDIVRIPVFPAKAHAPVVVHANAVLSLPISLEWLQPITGRNPQIIQALGGVELNELAQHDATKLSREAPAGCAGKEPLRLAIGEASNHPSTITPYVMIFQEGAALFKKVKPRPGDA
jgi:hypothetical protein